MSSTIANTFNGKNRMAIAAIAGVAASGVLVWGASNAAFTGSIQNDGNTWDAANIELENDHASALFTPSEVSPGYTEKHCITITSNSTVPVDVKVYGENVVAGLLADNLLLTIEEGAGGTNVDGVAGAPGDCTGFVSSAVLFDDTLADFAALTDYATGDGNATLANGGEQQYMITATLPAGAPDSLQGESTGASFVWEGQG